MGIGEKLAGIYAGIEDKWFGALDWLDSKGIPVYAYSDFFENKGIPSFPVTIAIIAIIAFLLYGIFIVGNTISPSISLSITDNFEDALSDVRITVKNAQGNEIKTTRLGNGSILKLEGIPLGSIITIFGEKEGYETDSKEITIARETVSIELVLEQRTTFIDAKVLLQNASTGDAVKGARIVATYRNISREATTSASGTATIEQVPEETEIALEITSDAYETITDNFSFTKNETKTIEMQPRSALLVGKSKLLLSIMDEEANPVKGAGITIRNKTNDSILYQTTSATGEYSADIEKGTSVRIVIEKDGFLRYDSLIEKETRTMLLDEETWQVILKSGGTSLKISVQTEAGTPIADATAQLFSLESEFLDAKQTTILGTTEFKDLNAERFFVTAFAEGYLPERTEIDAASRAEATIKLKSADATNSSYLAVYVIDALNAMANNTDLFFFEKIADRELPLGIPAMKTDLSGYASTRLQIGTNVLVKAKRGIEEGQEEKTIQANTLNELRIQLEKTANIVELLVLDEFGSPAKGRIRITTPEGELLFDGNIGFDGKVFFDSVGKERVNIEVTDSEGKTFSEQLDLLGKDTAEIRLGAEAIGFAPETKFLGVFDATGKQVEGIVPGEFFWLKFETTWASGNYNGGLHVRIGNDAVKFVDSEEAGIMGFDATGKSFAAGKSYQPLPEPGNETADRQNKGNLGEYNKWIEIFFEKPQNTIVAKVKIKARESIQAQKIEAHYRAWAEIAGKYYRSPEDTVLGNAKYVTAKTGLYAETKLETIPIVQSLPECKKDLCASYYFLQKNGLIIETENFKPLLNETYSLEIDLSSAKETTANISLETGIPALLYFTGHETDSFQNTPKPWEKNPLPATTSLGDLNAEGTSSGYLKTENNKFIEELLLADKENNEPQKLLLAEATPIASGGYLYEKTPIVDTPEAQENPFGFKENDSTNTKTTIPGIQLLPNQVRKIRAYFKTVDSGDAFIKTDITASGVALSKTLRFAIPKQKEMLITIIPEEIFAGKDFTINAKNKETSEAIPNATIHLLDAEGKLALSIIGDGTKTKGLNGNYEIKNNLKPGKYKAEITAQDFVPAETKITIAVDGMLQIPKEIKILIPKGAQEAAKTEQIRNKGEQEITGLSYEIETGNNFPEEFSTSMELPAVIASKQNAPATIRAQVFLNTESKESLHGEAEITISGTVAGQYPTKTKTKLIIDYNKKFLEDCLKFDTAELRVKLMGRAGSSVQAQLEIENNCETAVTLTPKIEAKEKDPNLTVNAQQTTIEKDAKQTVPITVSNSIDRLYSMQQTFSFNIIFDSPQVSKSASLKVELWNPIANLAFPPQVSLWLTQAQGQGFATDNKPLYLRNTGREPITGFRLAVDDSAYKQYGITAYLAPMSTEYGFLAPGGILTPTRHIVAQATTGMPLPAPATGYVHYTGIATGRQMDFGVTTVSVNYQGNQCLKIEAKGNISFQSKQNYGVQQQPFTVRNDCGEEVRIREIKPKSIGSNTLYLVPPDNTIMPNSEQEIKLQINISQNMAKTEQVRLSGWLVRSQKWVESNPLPVRIDIGEKTMPIEAAMQGPKVRMKVCNSDSEKEIVFPRLGDCSNGYCDAKKFAFVVAEKIKALVKEARAIAERAQGRAEQFACKDKLYCTFSDLGIKTQGFFVYSQLDTMTPELLSQIISENKITEIENYSVDKRTDIIDEQDLGEKAATGFQKIIYLGEDFRGCGRYFISIYGAAQVINNEIMKDSFMILVKPDILAKSQPVFPSSTPILDLPAQEQTRMPTEGCTPKIQNIANFLPIDQGLTSSDYPKAWPGIIETGSKELETLGKEIAKQLFKMENGRTVQSIQNANKIELVLGDNEDALVKLGIENIDETGLPRTAKANIRQEAASNQKSAAEIGSAIEAFMKGSPSKDTCISQDETFVLINSYEKPINPLEFSEKPDSIKVNGGETFIEFTITGVVGDKIKFSTDFLEKTNTTGIEYIRITDEKGKNLLWTNADKTTGKTDLEYITLKEEAGSSQPSNPTTARTIEAQTKKTALLADTPSAPATMPSPEPSLFKKASARIRFYIKGDTKSGSSFVLAPQNVKSITLNAEPINYPNRQAKGKEIKIEACGLHISELLDKMKSVDPKKVSETPDKKMVFFATISWNGDPEKIDFDYVQKKFDATIAQKEAGERLGISGGNVASNPVYKMSNATKAIIGVWTGYFVPCAITAAIWGGLTKLGVGAFWNVGFDCAVPAVWATKNYAKELGDTGKTISTGIDDFIRRFIPIIGKWIVGKEPSTEQRDIDSFSENILAPAIVGTTLDSSLAVVKNAGVPITPASADSAAKEVAGNVVGYLKKTKFQGVTGTEIDALLTGHGGLQEKLIDKIKNKILVAQASNPVENKFISNVIEASSKEAFAEVGDDVGALVVAAGKAGRLGSAATTYKNTKQSLVAGLFNEESLANSSKTGVITSVPERVLTRAPTEITRFKTNLTGKFEENIKAELRLQMGTKQVGGTTVNVFDDLYASNPVFKNEFDRLMTVEKTQIEQSAFIISEPERYNGKIVKDPVTGRPFVRYKAEFTGDLGSHARRLTANLRTGPASEILAEEIVSKQLGKTVVTEATTDAWEGAHNLRKGVTPLHKEFWQNLGSRIKSSLSVLKNRAFLWNTFKSLGKGISGGVLANYLGYKGWQYYWEKAGTAPDAPIDTTTAIPTIATTPRGPGFVRGLTEILKNSTYKIEVSSGGKDRHYNFSVLAANKDFEEMAKQLEAKKAELWESKDCIDFFEKRIDGIGELRPGWDTEEGKPELVNAYWSNESAFAIARMGNPTDLSDDAPEADIMALMIVQPKKIVGCGIPNDWHDKDSATIKAYIDCAAGTIRNKEFETALKTIAGTDTKYYNEVLKAREKWAKTKARQAS